MLGCLYGPVAQSAEHLPFKQRVPGSSPGRLTLDSISYPPSHLPVQ